MTEQEGTRDLYARFSYMRIPPFSGVLSFRLASLFILLPFYSPYAHSSIRAFHAEKKREVPDAAITVRVKRHKENEFRRSSTGVP